MNLYIISQSINSEYDTYSDAVVAAENEEEARRIHPGDDRVKLPGIPDEDGDYWECRDWVHKCEDVRVELIGTAIPGTEAGVICASYHAG